MNRRLIGFCGRKRAGKTCLAKMLQEEENAVIVTVANYLKYLCCDLMNLTYEELIEKKDNGFTFDIVPDERWFKIIDNRTKIGIDNIRKELEGRHITSIRELLQIIGTDVIRKYNENWHVEKMIEEIESYSEDRLIVVDDVRFPNERQAILDHSGEVFFIVRPNVLDVSNHVSETALKWQDFDERHIIINGNIREYLFKLAFMIHYRNGFDINVNGSIFLYENKDYLNHCNFAYNYDKDDELLTDMLRQIKEDKMFKEFGVISYHTHSRKLAERYVNEVDDRISVDPYISKFLTYNPLITENLKMFL